MLLLVRVKLVDQFDFCIGELNHFLDIFSLAFPKLEASVSLNCHYFYHSARATRL